MIRLGVNTWLWTSRFEEQHLFCIDNAVEVGAEAIDFSVGDPYGFPVEKTAEKLKGSGLDVIVSTALPTHCNPISPDRWERKAAADFIRRLVDIAVVLGSPIVGGVTYVGSGYHTGVPRTAKEVELAVEHLREVCGYAADKGITIAMEPVKRFETHFMNTAGQAMELIEATGVDNLKVHLDFFHMNIEEANIPDAIRSCKDKLAYLHLVDSNRDTPGKGHVPWKEAFEALRDIGFDGAGCIETFNPATVAQTGCMTYLMRSFANSPEEMALDGLGYLKGIRREVFGE